MKFYRLYSYWVYVLFVLHILKVIPFSITPTIIGTFLGSIVFFLLKEKKNRNLSILLIMLHILPFFFVSFDFTTKDILINILIFLFYLITLELQGTNMIKEYSQLDIDKPIGKYYRDLFNYHYS
jgi:hypothetical protein